MSLPLGNGAVAVQGPSAPQGAAPSAPPQGANPPQPSGSGSETQGQVDLASISVASRISPFWRDMPRLWFTQFEAILAPQRLGQEAKFDLVVGKLGKEELNIVSDLLESTANRDYAGLKERLVATFQESADIQFHRLVKELELGDQKPSQLYRKMAEAARNSGVADSTVRKLWIQRLPTAVRAILSVSEDTKLENLVAMADKIMESIGHGVVAEIAAPTSSQMSLAGAEMIQEFRNMTLEMKQLRGEVNELRSRPNNRGNFRGGRNRSRSRSRSKAAGRNPNWLCSYHYKFRENARKCFQPCAWERAQQQAAAPPAAPHAWQQQQAAAPPAAPHAWQQQQGN